MDAFYDKTSAAAELQTIASVRREALAARVNSSVVHLADINVRDYKTVDVLSIQEMGDHFKNWRLCLLQRDDGVADEVVTRIQGVVTKNGLVPKNAHTCGRRKATFLSQQIEICGLDTETFGDAVRMVAVIVEYFEQHLGGAELRTITEVDGAEGKIFRASNRIFTARADAPTEQDNAFQPGVDPLNVLGRLKGNDLIHAPENIVRFYRRLETDGNTTYDDTVPGVFKVGDLVELQVSFVAIKAATNKVKVTTRLQAVTLLSNEFSKGADKSRKASQAPAIHRVEIRRRVGHFAEDDEAERQVKKRRIEEAEGEMS